MGKVYEDYTIGDLQRLDLSFLVRNRSEAGQKEQREAFAYLLQTATALNVDIMNWKLLPDFGNPDVRGLMNTNRERINEVLFGKIGKTEDVDSPIYTDVPFIGEKERISEFVLDDTSLRESIASASSDAKYYVREYEQSMESAENYRVRAAEERATVMRLQVTLDNIKPSDELFYELCKVQNSPNWNFYSLNGNIIEFHTTAPCIQSEVNAEAGINHELNCGYIRGSLNLSNMNLVALPFIGNYTVDSKMHPHVGSSNTICFGDAANTVNDLKNERKVAEIFEILYQLLNTYSPNNPYIALTTMLDEVSGPFTVRKDAVPVPEGFVSALDPSEYLVNVPWDNTSTLEKGSLAFDMLNDGSIYRLAFVTQAWSEGSSDSVHVRRTSDRGFNTNSTYSISRNNIAPFDPTNADHLAFLRDGSGIGRNVLNKNHPVLGTVVADSHSGRAGRLYTYGGGSGNSIETMRETQSVWNFTIFDENMETQSVKARSTFVVKCQENYDLGWTAESIDQWNGDVPVPSAELIGKFFGISQYLQRPTHCRFCDEEFDGDERIDSDDDVRCDDCSEYTRCEKVTLSDSFIRQKLVEKGVIYPEQITEEVPNES